MCIRDSNHIFSLEKRSKSSINCPEINAILGESTVSERTCRNWVTKFENNLFDIEDSPRSGRPKTDIDDKLKEMLETDPSKCP